MAPAQTDVALSSATLDPASALVRESPRPPDMRNARYDAAFDYDTLFYDCYRVGGDVVLQGPPFLNLLPALLASAPLRRWFGRPRHMGQHKRGELWLRERADHLTLTGPIGTYHLPIGADLSHLYSGRRTLLTISKNNAPRWIHDWVQFYRREHAADAVLIYDNGSTDYTWHDLQGRLRAAFPDMVIHVVSWPFKFGPQGGLAGAIDGRETPWDSNFCQTGALQHARFRLLRRARCVLSVDIDELVLGDSGGSIFEHTERSRTGLTKMAGHWISGAAQPSVTSDTCRHADFTHRDERETRICPPKWCLAPRHDDRFGISWSEHNLFGSRHNRRIDPAFTYRHMTAISTSWKEDRGIEGAIALGRLVEDTALAHSFARVGLA